MTRNKTLAVVLLALTLTSAPVSAQEAALRASLDPATSEIVLAIGPLSIPAGGHDLEQPKVEGVPLPVAGYIHGWRVELVDGQGREVPAVLLHHVNIIAPHRRELFSRIMQRVAAAGAETGDFVMPRLFGYPVNKGDSLIVSAMLHNPTAQSYENVELRVRMKYSTPSSVIPTISIQPFYIDVMPPAGVHAFTIPPGRSTKSWEGSPAVPGRVLAIGGHMHKYGVSLRFENVTKNKVLWEAKPAVDTLGNVVGMPRKYFLWRLGVQLDPSHTYRLTAEYDNPTGETIEEGAMGTLGGVFVPDDRAEWPEVDPDHPEYVEDVKVTFARNSGAAPAHHH